MKMLTGDIKRLLDKIYNLRSDDSVVLSSITEEREKAIETQERTKNEKEILLKDIDKITKDKKVLEDQGKKLIDLLSNINSDDFNIVLERLNIDFNPNKINDEVRASLPKTIETLAEENQTKSEELKEVEKEMKDSMALVEELGLRKDEALSNQAKLNEYIELALKGNINITRDAITSLLEKFSFDENEQREAAKLLMFPEDALYEYDASIKRGENVTGKSMADVFAEAKELSDNDDITKEISDFLEENAAAEKVTFEDKKDEETAEPIERMETKEVVEEPKEEVKEEPIIEETEEEIVDAEPTIEKEEVVEEAPTVEEPAIEEETEEPIAEPVIEESKEEKSEEQKLTKEQLMDKLSNLGVDNGLLTPSALTKVLDNYDEELLNKNIGILKDNSIDFKVIKGNADLLYDKELGDKISKLLEIGKLASDISLVPSVLTKYDLKGLTNTINVLQISGLDPKKVPLMAF